MNSCVLEGNIESSVGEPGSKAFLEGAGAGLSGKINLSKRVCEQGAGSQVFLE